MPRAGAAVLADHDREGAELLAERHRHGVLQLGAADLQHVGEFVAPWPRRRWRRAAISAAAADAEPWRQAQRRRVDVVGALRRVDVVVRVQRRVVALRVPHHLQRAVGDHLVGVHVGRGAGAALDDVDDELVVQVPGESSSQAAGWHGALRVEHAERGIGLRRRLLRRRRARAPTPAWRRPGWPEIGKFSTARGVCTPQ